MNTNTFFFALTGAHNKRRQIAGSLFVRALDAPELPPPKKNISTPMGT